MIRPRAWQLGVPFDGVRGALDAITDVAGVEVGYATIVRPPDVHTGVTAIWPRGRDSIEPCFAGVHVLNGNGELTGAAWIEESGVLEGPIALTNTYSVGTVHDAVLRYHVKHQRLRLANVGFGALPVVAETWDGELNDIEGFHVAIDDVFAALDGARGGAVAEGNVGGGTGMTLFEWKGGTGTASRVAGDHTVGVLAQCNFGSRAQLTVAGVPVGRHMALPSPRSARPRATNGSIIVVIATDAPVLPHQLARLARRATHGLARSGSISEDSSGDLFLALSTAHAPAITPAFATPAWLDDLFAAVVHATEESIINALVAAETTSGFRGNTYEAIDTGALVAILRAHGRIT